MGKVWLGLLSGGALLGALGTSCGGGEFGSKSRPSPAAAGDAGETGSVEANGGDGGKAGSGISGGGGKGSSGSATGGSSQAGEPSSMPQAGEPSLPPDCKPDDAPMCANKLSVATCDAAGTWQFAECEAGPQDCAAATCSNGKCVRSTLTPANAPGDCQQWQCTNGTAKAVPAIDDLPAVKGTCDVASCTEQGPVLTDDSSRCAVNKQCQQGACICRACPNGKLENVEADTCRMPTGMTASATHSNMGSSAAGAIDGDAATTWNAGKADATLTLQPSSTQAMTALVLYVTGQADSMAAGAKTISVQATIEVDDNTPPIVKNGSFDYSAMVPTGPIRLELGLVRVKKITLHFSSPTSWIAVNEAMFVLCS